MLSNVSVVGSFLLLSNISLNEYTKIVSSFFCQWTFGVFLQFGAVMNRAAMKFLYKSFVDKCFSEELPKNETSGSLDKYMFILKEIAKFFSKVVVPFHFLTNKV